MMAASRRLVRFVSVGTLGLAVLVLNPVFGVFSGPSFGADELRAAVEGTWRLTVATGEGAERTVTFALVQGAKPVHAGAERTLVRSAAACGSRSLVRTAGACMDTTEMPLEVTLLADGARRPQPEPGELMVIGTRFEQGRLRVAVAELQVTATITPSGEAIGAASEADDGRGLRSTLVRIAR